MITVKDGVGWGGGGNGDMTQSVKCLPCKHEEPSSSLSTYAKQSRMKVYL